MSKYQCYTDHTQRDAKNLGGICPECHIVLKARHDRMLKFIKDCANYNVPDDPRLLSKESKQLLKEIGL